MRFVASVKFRGGYVKRRGMPGNYVMLAGAIPAMVRSPLRELELVVSEGSFKYQVGSSIPKHSWLMGKAWPT